MKEEIANKIKEKLAYVQDFKHGVLFKIDDEALFIDGKQTPPEIVFEEREADTTLSCSKEVLTKILEGTQDPNIAFMTGKLKITGSMGVAMKLNALLED